MINFKTCTEEELWKYVAAHLESKGLEVVLVGGAVVSIYSKVSLGRLQRHPEMFDLFITELKK